jgi:hypothetical protein
MEVDAVHVTMDMLDGVLRFTKFFKLTYGTITIVHLI